MYGFLRGLSTGVFLRGCAWMSVPDNNTENHEVVLRELSWLPGNKLARFSAAETLEPAPVNLENVTQKLHSMKTPPGKTQSRRVSQWTIKLPTNRKQYHRCDDFTYCDTNFVSHSRGRIPVNLD